MPARKNRILRENLLDAEIFDMNEINSEDVISENDLTEMSIFQLIGKVIKLSQDTPIEVTGNIEIYLNELCRRLNLTPMQALLMSVFVNKCDDNNIHLRDIANHFGETLCSVLSVSSDIDSLIEQGIIVCIQSKKHTLYNNRSEKVYRVPQATIDSLKKGCLPKRASTKAENADDWIDAVDALLEQRKMEEIGDSELVDNIDNLMAENMHLEIVKRIGALNLPSSSLVLFLVISLCYINERDERISERDIRDYFIRRTIRQHISGLLSGTHILMEKELVEHVCVHGFVDSQYWCLSEKSKNEIYSEFQINMRTKESSSLKKSDSIDAKELYFNDSLQKQIDEMKTILKDEQLNKIQEKLGQHGMRKGVAILLYGAPGTGKTETVQQIARMTGRDIMQVDIPSIRSKWVGETEKNIKKVFDTYKQECKNCTRLPILLFNEADAILTSRMEHTSHSVDKMENAMQNIILQEMETLDGIMVATTNLTGVLDSAFERRFLFKIEFEKPNAEIRSKIWRSMLPNLTDMQAEILSKRYDFTGGQIENITRKNIISSIISLREDIDFNTILENCKTEIINQKDARRVGFIN